MEIEQEMLFSGNWGIAEGEFISGNYLILILNACYFREVNLPDSIPESELDPSNNSAAMQPGEF